MIRPQQARSGRVPPRAFPSLKDPLRGKHAQCSRQRFRMCSSVPREFLRASRRFPQGIRNTKFCYRVKTPGQAVTHRNSQKVVSRIVHGGSSITTRVNSCVRQGTFHPRKTAYPSAMPSEPDHVPLRRIWDFKIGQLKLDFVEYLHVIDCEKCRASFRACIRSSTFEEAQTLTGPSN